LARFFLYTCFKKSEKMKTKYFLSSIVTFALLLSFTVSNAQITFQKKFGGKLQESAHSMAILSDGYLILGHSTSYSAAGDTDVYIIRTDLNGAELWHKFIGGPGQDVGYSMQATNDGNFIVCGSTSTTATINPDAWLFKMDKNAVVLWSQTQATTGIDVGYDVQQTADNGYIIAGFTDVAGATNHDSFLWKTDANGKFVFFNKSYGGPATDEAHSVKQTSDGGFIFIGETLNTPAGDRDFYLVKTTADGTFAWSKNYGGADYERGQYVELTSDGYILTGDTKSYGAGDYDIYIIKIDATGTVQWTKTFGGTDKDISKMIRKTTDGGYIVAGISRSFNRVNPDFWILKLKANGDTLWTRLYGGPLHEHCYYANQTTDGGYVAVGHTVNAYTPDYDVDVYFVKMNSEGRVVTGLSEIENRTEFRVFPNPGVGIFNVEMKENGQAGTITVTDLTGRTLYSQHLVAGHSTTQNIDLSLLSKGIYLINVSSGSNTTTRKILLQ
jgi:hypothetical protein